MLNIIKSYRLPPVGNNTKKNNIYIFLIKSSYLQVSEEMNGFW